MLRSFKEFVLSQKNAQFKEQDAAPSIGAVPETPSNPKNSTTNKHFFSSLKRQMGMDNDGLRATLEGDAVTIFQVPDYSKKWGFLVAGPCPAVLSERKDGNYDITYLLTQKQLLNPESFILSYKAGDDINTFTGKIEDKTEIIDPESLQDILTKPFSSLVPT